MFGNLLGYVHQMIYVLYIIIVFESVDQLFQIRFFFRGKFFGFRSRDTLETSRYYLESVFFQILLDGAE